MMQDDKKSTEQVTIDAVEYLDEPIFLPDNSIALTKPTERPICFEWSMSNFGFGELNFWYEDGKLKCDNEAMSKETVKKLLCAFVDKAEFIS